MTPPTPFAPAPRAFLGKGLAFPLGVDAHGRIAAASGEAKVEQAIWLLLSTALGERVMRPALGCAAHDSLFEPASTATIARIVDQVRRALVTYRGCGSTCSTSGRSRPMPSPASCWSASTTGSAATTRSTNLVYPFFIEEGV